DHHVIAPIPTRRSSDLINLAGSVHDPVDAFRELATYRVGKAFATEFDDIGTELLNQIVVFFGSIGNDGQSATFGQLDHIPTKRPGCAGHGQGRTGRQV